MRKPMNNPQQLKKVAKTLAKLHDEVKRQFDDKGFPMVYQVGETTVIGDETVQRIKGGAYKTGYFPTCRWRYYPEHMEFAEYQSAVSFCIARQRRKSILARDIYNYDRLVNKYWFDQQNFVRLFRSAIKKRDIFTAELYKLRLEESMLHYQRHKEHLNQLCVEAKYNNKQSG